MPRSPELLGHIGMLLFAVSIAAMQTQHEVPYQVHQLERATVTQAHPRRDATCAIAGWALCSADAGGGCCPDNYKCDGPSCVATTAGPSTACGKAGYYNCPLDTGPGSCCPVGLICAKIGGACVAPEGVSMSLCPANYHSCPASLGSGCCKSGMACGRGLCYSTALSTYTISVPVTTTNSVGIATTKTVAAVTTITPTAAAGDLEAASDVLQLRPSTVAKMSAVETGNNSGGSSGGLSQGALGGIIGGCVAILLVILVATWLILRRLKKTQKAAEEAAAARRESSRGTGDNKRSFGQPTVTEITGYGYDGLDPLQSPSIRPSHVRSTSDNSIRDSSPSRTSRFRASGTSTPYGAWPGQYNPVPTSDAADSRRQSVESFQAHDVRYSQQTVPAMPQQQQYQQGQAHQHRTSYDSQMTRPSQGRHLSYSSELEGMHGLSELDDQLLTSGRRRSSSGAAMTGSYSHRGSVELPNSPRVRCDSATGADGEVGAGTGLMTVNEISELDGYYGPQTSAAGETAARLNRFPSMMATPIDAYQRPTGHQRSNRYQDIEEDKL